MSNTATAALLSRMGDRLHLTDGGLETAMIFHEGLELPHFAAFTLLGRPEGRAAMRRYFTGFLDQAARLDLGFVLDTATWRASEGWGETMGLQPGEIDRLNREAVAFAQSLRDAHGAGEALVNGVLGPHGDAYRPDSVLGPEEAFDYHHRQVGVLADEGVDLVTAMTISSTGEAIGIAEAAQDVGVPVALSFTVETDGRLIDGMTLAEAIGVTDAATKGYPAWYGVNCAHPDHFAAELRGAWTGRLGLIRANASRLSHAELDEATELDDGDPEELARAYAAIRMRLPGLRVLGGCCGTDLRHVAAIGRECH
ncbi:homocysteine S-methyltransferase family protein [Rhodobacteraceae bacterium KMS-5]|uniref:Homocysteine S-methyltransferase family protein n=2 Tax=Tabrizicola oligotrophica TaxID=2710650 RepID=A0A6M0QNP1_9RHOB|nr:homocysteine S-methyltransferase family protein [Tabrizicola oligotrophica]